MQPKRDPNDRRYWPATKGGTGQGFTTLGKELSPHRYGALNTNGSLSSRPRHQVKDSIDLDGASTRPTKATRERARCILDRALDRLGEAIDDDKPLTVNEIAGAVNALAKVSGVTSIQVEVSGSVAHLHLAALQSPRATTIGVIATLATGAHALPEPEQIPYTEPVQGE